MIVHPNLVDRQKFDSSLCLKLQELAEGVDQQPVWPQASLAACSEAEVFRWFVPKEFGGWGWSDLQILEGYLAVSQSCMTTAFILTQWHAACRRVLSSTNTTLRNRLAPRLASGELFATVGISHLTTSRQHLSLPALRAIPTSEGYRLQGSSPWVTGAAAADLLVLGATVDDASQILVAVPKNRSGIIVQPSLKLIALSSSCTGPVDLDGVLVQHDEVLAGPEENVLTGPAASGNSAGGLHTSVLAVGLASRAAQYLVDQSHNRQSLSPVARKLQADVQQQRRLLQQLCNGEDTCTTSQLRRQANSLVLRATQAALQTAKGAGFIDGHPAGRWAREALFFLVWSCPQAVMEANLCDLAGLEAQL